MQKPGEDLSDQGKTVMSIVDFIGLAGIGPELAEFVTEFIERPETFFSMSFERRCEIENQMDAILSSFGQRLAMHSKPSSVLAETLVGWTIDLSTPASDS
jgi:hypothetical protein